MSKFNFDEQTLKILGNFSTINPSMLVEPDRLSVMNLSKSVVGMYKFDKPYSFDSFGLYDTADFLSVLSAMKKSQNMNIEDKDKYLLITSDNDRLTYYTTAKDMILKVPDIDVLFKDANFEMEFSLPNDRLAIIKQMASILKSKFLFFETDNKRIRITVGDELESSSNNFEVFIETGIVKNELSESVKLPLADFKIINGDYTIKIANKIVKGKSKFFSQWKNLNGVDYLVATESSKWLILSMWNVKNVIQNLP